MKNHRILTTLAVALAIVGAGSSTAMAAQLDQGTYHDESTSFTSCDNGLELQTDVVNDGKYTVVEHGDGTWGYLVERWNLSSTTTNLATGDTYRTTNKGLAFKDQRLVDNGDGTQTLYVNSTASVRVYAPDGHLAYSGSGLTVYVFLVDGDNVDFVDVDSFHGQDTTMGRCDTAASFWL